MKKIICTLMSVLLIISLCACKKGAPAQDTEDASSSTVVSEQTEDIDLTDTLNKLEYYGDISQCRMTPEMAGTFAVLLRNNNAPIVKAAIFDGGNGIPMIWIAWGDEINSNGAIEGNYKYQIYRYENGAAVECQGSTSESAALLRAGEKGVVEKTSTAYDSEFAYDFKLHYLSNGTILPEPFATGRIDPTNDSAVLNGEPVEGIGTEDLDVYRLVESDLEVLLETGINSFADMLFLTGNWNEGTFMEQVLSAYSACAQ